MDLKIKNQEWGFRLMIDFTDYTWIFDNYKLCARKRKMNYGFITEHKMFDRAYKLNDINYILNNERFKLQSTLDDDASSEFLGFKLD